MKSPRDRSRAFSLVEVALSLAILAVAMTGVLALLPVGLDSARQVHAETAAVLTARRAMADLWLSNSRAASFTLPAPTFFTADGTPTNETALGAYFQITYSTNPAGGNPNVCRYFLRMEWPKNAARAESRQKRVFFTEVMREANP